MKLNPLLFLLLPVASLVIPQSIKAQNPPSLEVESFEEFRFPDLEDSEINLETPQINPPQINPQFNQTPRDVSLIADFNTNCQRVEIFRRDYQSESFSEFQVGKGRDRLFMRLSPLSTTAGCLGIGGIHPVSTANGLNGKDYSFVQQGILIRAYIPDHSACSLLEFRSGMLDSLLEFRSGMLENGVLQEYEQNCQREGVTETESNNNENAPILELDSNLD